MLHFGEQEEKKETKNLGIIVGAGPVGLYAAFILLMQGVNVTMYEPREKFKDRRQVVQVNSNFAPRNLSQKFNTQDRWIITYPALHRALAKVGCPIASLYVGTFLWPGSCTNTMKKREKLFEDMELNQYEKLGDKKIAELQESAVQQKKKELDAHWSNLESGVQTFPINVIQQVLLELCYKTADDKGVCFHFYRGCTKENTCDVEDCESCSELSWKEMTNDKCKDSDSKSKHLPNKWEKGRQTGGCKTAPLTGKELDMLLKMNPKYLLLAMGAGIKKDIDNWWNKHINGHNGEVEIDKIMFRKYGIVLEGMEKDPMIEMQNYESKEYIDSAVAPDEKTNPGRTNLEGEFETLVQDQTKFRVFSTVNGGLYLAVLSDAGNTIFKDKFVPIRDSRFRFFNKRTESKKKEEGMDCMECNLNIIEDEKNEDCIEKIIETEVKDIYDKIRTNQEKKMKNSSLMLPAGLAKEAKDIKIGIPGVPHLFHVNTYAFTSNGTVVARIGDSGYNRHFFTGSSMNTGMLSTLDLLTKCGKVRDIRTNATIKINVKESPDIEPKDCKAQNQVKAYNETQKKLQTLIPKEFEFNSGYRRPNNSRFGPDALSPVTGDPISLNCNLVKFFDYFVRYNEFINWFDDQSKDDQIKIGMQEKLVEFKHIFYPDFCQMLKEQGRKNITHTKQIITSLLQQTPKDLRQYFCGADKPSNFPFLLNVQVIRRKNPKTMRIQTKKGKEKNLATAGTTPNLPIIRRWDFNNYKKLIEYVVKLKNKTLDRINPGLEQTLTARLADASHDLERDKKESN